MILKNIQLTQFKNHSAFSSNFLPDFNIISGANGVGKTNVLDAIYAACTGRCYFNRSDKYNIQDGQEYGVIQVDFEKGEESNRVIIGLRLRGAKSIKLDGGKNLKLTEYIGRYPVVFIGPGDILLVNGRSEERRKYLDTIIAQTSADYLHNLMLHNKLLDMRNKQLKQFAEGSFFDPLLLEAIDQQLIEPAEFLHKSRTKFLEEFKPFFEEVYREISEDAETPSINYISHLNEAGMVEILKNQLPKDRILERTSRGIHKDDLRFDLGDFDIKTYGSQGQIKSFVISLKLAAYRYLSDKIGTLPLLLLDDIFEKIDGGRAERLLKLISGKNFGQVFITDTEKDRVHQALEGVDAATFDVILQRT